MTGQDEGLSALTPKEIEVLALLGRGKSNREIARELSISVKTVEYHVSNILVKLNLPNRTRAAIYALRGGGDSRRRENLEECRVKTGDFPSGAIRLGVI